MGHDLQFIARQFRTRGEPVEIAPVPVGHINDTYVVTTWSPAAPGWGTPGTTPEGGGATRYILQRINQIVFTKPVAVMANVVRITEHIRAKLKTECPLFLRQLVVIAAKDGQAYYEDAAGNVWRMYNFIENALTYDSLQDAALAREAARMFGWFQKLLTDLPGPPLHETIRGFHDTPARFVRFQEVFQADAVNRAKTAQAEIDFVFENAALCHVLSDLVARGEIPVRIAHNDAKINNVMFDTSTCAGVCVIDLDTVMPGLAAYDFGDLVRTATCPAAEDERDLSKVAVDITLFDALAQGFVAETGPFLTPAERQHLVFGGQLITFEQMIRFLTDYLAGDVYYKVHRAGHNLDRTRTQMKLVQSILEQEEQMNRLVERALGPEGPGS
ncbi:MAG: aminoglycoside phosphotransferase family protein [Planctomycetes bacterium]|nr:aminoglycoside phosphotransferase family protein [Planctomycetota bacterium]